MLKVWGTSQNEGQAQTLQQSLCAHVFVYTSVREKEIETKHLHEILEIVPLL